VADVLTRRRNQDMDTDRGRTTCRPRTGWGKEIITMDPLGDDRMGACHSAKLNVSFEPQVLAGKFLLSQKLLVLQ
jgi:hypothetical protein